MNSAIFSSNMLVIGIFYTNQNNLESQLRQPDLRLFFYTIIVAWRDS